MAYPRICDRRLYRELPTYKIYFLGLEVVLFPHLLLIAPYKRHPRQWTFFKR